MWPKDARKYGKPYRNQDDDGSPIKEKRKVTGKSIRTNCLMQFIDTYCVISTLRAVVHL